MKQIVTKQVSAVVVGKSPQALFIYKLLKETLKDAVLIDSETQFRFIGKNIASIKGVKTKVKKVLIETVLPTEKEQVVQNTAVAVVGCDNEAIARALNYVGHAQKIFLISESTHILEDYDNAVQDVITRFLKKSKVKMCLETAVLSSVTARSKHYITAEHSGMPLRIIADTLLLPTVLDPQAEHYGLSNAGIATNDALPSNTMSVNETVGLLGSQNLTLRNVEELVQYMTSKKKSYSIHSPNTHICRTESYVLFSIGTTEQSIGNVHTGYRKSVMRLPTVAGTPTYFVKLLASTSGRIIGVSGVIEHTSFDLDLLHYFVQNKTHLRDAKKMIYVDTKNSSYLYDAIASL